MSSSIEKEVIQIVADISGYEPHEIFPEMNFFENLGIDSIKAIEITVALEKKFKIAVRDEDVPKITTIKQAVDLVGELVRKKSATDAQ